MSGSHRGRPGAWWGAGRAPGGRASGRRPGGGRAPSGLVGRRSGAEWVDPGLVDDTERTWLRQTTQAGNPAAKFAGPRFQRGGPAADPRVGALGRRQVERSAPLEILWPRVGCVRRAKHPGRPPGSRFGPFGPSWVPKSVVERRISVPKTAPPAPVRPKRRSAQPPPRPTPTAPRHAATPHTCPPGDRRHVRRGPPRPPRPRHGGRRPARAGPRGSRGSGEAGGLAP